MGDSRGNSGGRRTLQFNRDGSFTHSVVRTDKETYKLEGNLLTINGPESDSDVAKETRQISIEGNILFIGPERIKCIRLSPRLPDKPAIVGKWQFEIPAYHGGTAGFCELEFGKNGDLKSWIELFPQKGSYKITGDLLVMTVNKERETNKFRFEEGLLILKSPPNTGIEEKFRRIDIK